MTFINFIVNMRKGYFSLFTTLIFAFNRIYFRDQFIVVFMKLDIVENAILMRLIGLLITILLSLIFAAILCSHNGIVKKIRRFHNSLLCFAGGFRDMTRIIFPQFCLYFSPIMRIFLYITYFLCYYGKKWRIMPWIYYLIGFSFFMHYIIYGFLPSFIFVWCLTSTRKYCRYVSLLMYPKGSLDFSRSSIRKGCSSFHHGEIAE